MNSQNTVEALTIQLNSIRHYLDALMKEMRTGFGWPKSENVSPIHFHLKNAESVISKYGQERSTTIQLEIMVVSNEKRISALERQLNGNGLLVVKVSDPSDNEVW